MILTLARILAVFLGILVISKTYHDYRKGKEGPIMYFFWIVAWLAIIVLAVYPALLNNIITRAGNGAGIGTLFGIFGVFLFYLVYRVYEKSQRVELQLRDLVSKLGLKDIDSNE